MAASRVTAAAKAVVLVLLAALSVTWTATLVTVGSGAPAAGQDERTALPDGTAMPTEAIEAPASVSTADAMSAGSAAQAIATASTNAIPSAALAAYQRAETVINNADETCNLPWQLVAAIGRVESDHGRFGGNSLDDEGVASPGIYGIALNGKRRTSLIRDTDGGELDRDQRFDRAVGPMQFIPSTWSVVGVDADGDGTRNPQDIDDAALATAVYLCSGNDDLAQEAGQRASVFRYNRSEQYVDLVLAIMNAYLTGDYTSVPNGTMAGGYLVPVGADPSARPSPEDRNPQGPGPTDGGGDPGPKDPAPGTPSPTPTPTPAPTPAPTPTPTPTPTPKSPNPTPTASPTPTLPVPVPTLPQPTPTVLLTVPQAIAECLSRGLVDDVLDTNDAFDQCVNDLTT